MDREIIIGYEDSDQGRDALALGGVLAEVLAARPVITTVLRFPDHLLGHEELEAALHRHVDPVLAQAAERLEDLDPKTQALVDDSPAHALHGIAEGEAPILIVVGSSHRGTIGRVLIGSVGRSLLSGGPCAIAVAPRDYARRAEHRVRAIGVAVNGSPEGWMALAAGVALAERVHVELRLVAVAPPPHYDYGALLAILSDQDYRAGEQRAMKRVLDAALERVPQGVAARSRLLQGDPGGCIAEVAEDFDLLIVGSRGYGPLRRALLGGVSAKLMHAAPCPVLILPRGAGDDPLRFDADAVARAAVKR